MDIESDDDKYDHEIFQKNVKFKNVNYSFYSAINFFKTHINCNEFGF